MTPDEYRGAQGSLFRDTIVLFLLVFRPLLRRRISDREWNALLRAIYPELYKRRRSSAISARRFYDSERAKRAPKIPDMSRVGESSKVPLVTPPRHDISLPTYEPAWLEEAVRPYKRDFAEPDTPPEKLTELAGTLAKQTLAGGRRAIINGASNDPIVRGWARIEGGGESCAFCKTLISRGPVYSSANAAGFLGTKTDALQISGEFQGTGDESVFSDDMMRRFHDNCDCLIVPVFDRASWPGRDQYQKYLKEYNDAQEWARSHPGKGGRFARLNNYRRYLASA